MKDRVAIEINRKTLFKTFTMKFSDTDNWLFKFKTIKTNKGEVVFVDKLFGDYDFEVNEEILDNQIKIIAFIENKLRIINNIEIPQKINSDFIEQTIIARDIS